MHINIRLLNRLRVLALLPVLVSPLLCVAGPPPRFSFDRALEIYNNVKTSDQLSDYLKTASLDDQKDYRYTLYRIRAYYAKYQFVAGDALVEEGLAGAKKAGLSDEDYRMVEIDLKNQKLYWMNRVLFAGPGGSGGSSETREDDRNNPNRATDN